jgi:hypothetical protein
MTGAIVAEAQRISSTFAQLPMVELARVRRFVASL